MTVVSDLDTPTLLVDLDRMERNIERWQRLPRRAGAPPAVLFYYFLI